MKLKYFISAAILPLLFMIAACDPREDPQSALRDALTFHASFDNGVNADFAKGDPVLYTATAVRPELRTRVGLPEEVSVTQGEGQFGNCLSFNPPDDIKGTRAFFKLKGNLPYKTEDWSGTVSFWLRVTPDEDLRPGYTDPIQLTPRSALDGCLWVDFDLSEERVFRMGAFPDKKYWNPDNKPNKDIPPSERPLIPLVKTPFSRNHWSHIVMTFEGFNNPGKKGLAKLFIDGKLHDDLTGWEQIYTWNVEAAQIRLGVNYVGHFDELSCFDRALNSKEVATLFALKNGVGSLLKN